MVGFVNDQSLTKEGFNLEVCVELCAGLLKRNASFYVDIIFNGSAECKSKTLLCGTL